MIFYRALTFSAFIFIPFVHAWGNLTGLFQALNAAGLDQFANAATDLNGTPAGQQVLVQLSQGNKTIFAPSDSAWSNLNSTDLNETALADIVSYHIVSGNVVNYTATYPNETVGHTLLNNPDYVMLGGNQSQALVWSKTGNGSYFVLNNGTNVTVTNMTTYNDSAILAINSLLDIPPNISTVLKNPSYNTSALAALLQHTPYPTLLQASILPANGSSVLDLLDSAHGITVFAPNNAGIQAAQGALSGILKNTTALQNVVSNHVINGTVVYANELSNSSHLVSAGGQNYTFNSNSTGQFVSVGGHQVQIVEPNVLSSNGVVHIVNGVMLDTNSNAAAASSAYDSATSVAAQGTVASSLAATSPFTSTPTASSPITSADTTTPTLTSTHTSTPTPTSGGMAKSGSNNWKRGALVGVIVGVGQLV